MAHFVTVNDVRMIQTYCKTSLLQEHGKKVLVGRSRCAHAFDDCKAFDTRHASLNSQRHVSHATLAELSDDAIATGADSFSRALDSRFTHPLVSLRRLLHSEGQPNAM